MPKSDEAYNIDIPGSVTLWEARARPTNSAQVSWIGLPNFVPLAAAYSSEYAERGPPWADF